RRARGRRSGCGHHLTLQRDAAHLVDTATAAVTAGSGAPGSKTHPAAASAISAAAATTRRYGVPTPCLLPSVAPAGGAPRPSGPPRAPRGAGGSIHGTRRRPGRRRGRPPPVADPQPP